MSGNTVKLKVYADWDTPCMVCENTPSCPLTGMCMPCTTGEADTIWEHDWDFEMQKSDWERTKAEHQHHIDGGLIQEV